MKAGTATIFYRCNFMHSNDLSNQITASCSMLVVIPGRVPLIELFNGVSLFGGRVFFFLFNITGFDAGQAEIDSRGFLLDTCHLFTTVNLAKMMYRMFSQVWKKVCKRWLNPVKNWATHPIKTSELNPFPRVNIRRLYCSVQTKSINATAFAIQLPY